MLRGRVLDKFGMICGYKPANVSLASSVRRVSQDPMDTASFFFSFESDLPGTLRLLSGGAPEVGGQVSQKTLAVPVFIVQNESCLFSNDSPCHHTRSGRDWPAMWGYRTLTPSAGAVEFLNR
jgi:hypothetical protein